MCFFLVCYLFACYSVICWFLVFLIGFLSFPLIRFECICGGISFARFDVQLVTKNAQTAVEQIAQNRLAVLELPGATGLVQGCVVDRQRGY